MKKKKKLSCPSSGRKFEKYQINIIPNLCLPEEFLEINEGIVTSPILTDDKTVSAVLEECNIGVKKMHMTKKTSESPLAAEVYRIPELTCFLTHYARRCRSEFSSRSYSIKKKRKLILPLTFSFY